MSLIFFSVFILVRCVKRKKSRWTLEVASGAFGEATTADGPGRYTESRPIIMPNTCRKEKVSVDSERAKQEDHQSKDSETTVVRMKATQLKHCLFIFQSPIDLNYHFKLDN